MALGVVGILWSIGRPYLLTIAFTWAGFACVANAKRCGRFHCHITGPLYLGLGLVSGLTGVGLLNINWNWIGMIFGDRDVYCIPTGVYRLAIRSTPIG